MADEKSLKIGMKFDDKGAKGAATSLGDLKKKTDDFNKSVGGLNKSLKLLNEELKLKVKDFGLLTKEMEKTGKGFASQIKAVDAYVKALDKLNKTLNATGKAQPGRRQNSANVVGGVASGPSFSGGGPGNSPANPLYVQQVGGSGAAGGPNQALPMPGGGFQLGNNRGTWLGGGNRVRPGQWLGGTPAAIPHGQFDIPAHRDMRMMAQATQQVANFFQEMKTLPAQNQATVKGLRGGMLKSMIGGDFSDALALTIMNAEGKSAGGKFGGRGLIGAGNAAGAIAGVFGGATAGLPGTISGAAGGIGSAWKSGVAGGKEAQESQALQAGIDAVKGMNPQQMAIFQNLLATSSSGLNASRRLGSGTSAWSGVGSGMGPQENWQFLTQGAESFGGQVMTGGDTGRTRTVPTGNTIQDPKKIAKWMSYQKNMDPNAWANMYGKEVTSGGMNTPEMRTESIRNPGLGSVALDFQKKGFDKNKMTQMLGNVQGNLTGGDSSRLEESKRMLTIAVGEGVKLGIKDVQTLESLSTAIAAATVSQTGGVMSGTGQLAGILAGGMGGDNANPLQIAQRAEALGLFSAAKEGNPFLKNRSMAQASENLGPEASFTDVSALSGASYSDLLGSGGRLGDSGITPKQKMAQLTSSLDTTINMAAASDKKTADLLAKYGGDVGKALKDPAFVNAASSSLAANVGGYSDYQANVRGLTGMSYLDRSGGEGMTEDQAAKQLKTLKDRGGAYLGAEQAKAQTQAQAITEAMKPENQALFQQTFASMGDFFKILAVPNNKENLNDAAATIKALEALIDKIAKLSPAQVNTVSEKIKPGKQ